MIDHLSITTRSRNAPTRGMNMNFRSDNEVGAHPRIVEAVARAFASGPAPSYGDDDWTHRVEHRLRDLFEKPDLVAFPVATGTAANVLSLACCTPSWARSTVIRRLTSRSTRPTRRNSSRRAPSSA